MYHEIKRPEIIRGIKYWRNRKNKFNVLMLHYTADPSKDPKRQGRLWYNNEKVGFPDADWKKEYEIDFTTKSGKLIYGKDFCDFNENIHCISSFELSQNVEYIMALDFGQRSPTAALIGAWTEGGILYIIDEYYKPALPSVSSKEMFRKFSYLFPEPSEGKSIDELRLMADTLFQIKVIDPTTRAKNRSKVKDGEEIQYSIIEDFYDNGWDFEPGNNDVLAGITRVREYFKVENGKTHLYIFKDKCYNFLDEIRNYRYKELSEDQSKTREASEEPVKKNDHLMDCLRYLVMTRPALPEKAEKPLTRIQKDILSLTKPQVDVSWDYD